MDVSRREMLATSAGVLASTLVRGRSGVEGPKLIVRADDMGYAHATTEEKVASFVRMLDGLEDGHTYHMVDHPGLDGPELRGIHHIGYEQVAADRQGVTDLFTDVRVRTHIKARNVQLVSYRDIR